MPAGASVRGDLLIEAAVVVYLAASGTTALAAGLLAPASASLVTDCAAAGCVAVAAGLRVRTLLSVALRLVTVIFPDAVP
jgi:hypothetical protein